MRRVRTRCGQGAVVVIACEGGRKRSGWVRTRDQQGTVVACEGG